jgi:hypothetical protein
MGSSLLVMIIATLMSYRLSYGAAGSAGRTFFEITSDNASMSLMLKTMAFSNSHFDLIWLTQHPTRFGDTPSGQGHVKDLFHIFGLQIATGDTDPRLIPSGFRGSKIIFVSVSEYWIIALFSLFFGYLGWPQYVRSRRARRISRGCCPQCGYDLRGSAKQCPECGDIR